MNKTYTQEIKSDVKNLYKTNDHARQLFEHFSSRQRNPSNTTVERIMSLIGINRWEAISLAKEIAETGCAQFAKGRAPNKTRLIWKFGCVGLAKIAKGEEGDLTPPPAGDVEEEEENVFSQNNEQLSPMKLTIPEAKEALAKTLGITPEQIEIIIKA